MKYLEKLRAAGASEKADGVVPTKLTKPGSVSFGTTSPPPASPAQGYLDRIDPEYHSALLISAMVICIRCRHYLGTADGEGRCKHYDVSTWPLGPFSCEGYQS